MRWAEKCQYTEDYVASTSSLFLCQDLFSPDGIGVKYLKKGTIPDRNLIKYKSCNNVDINEKCCRIASTKKTPLTVS